MALISVRNLSVGYDNNIVASDISFDINRKDYVCVAGHNGSGKSTMIKTIVGIQSPMSGKIERDKSLHHVGYLGQQTLVQKDFPASVGEVVLSGCQAFRGLRPFYSKEEKLIASKNLELLHIDDLRNKCYRELSGGQQQRVLLARALCAAKDLLVMDEPVASLDPDVRTEFYKIVKKLNGEGLTVIMVSHDLEDALRDASHIAFFGNGFNFCRREDFKK